MSGNLQLVGVTARHVRKPVFTPGDTNIIVQQTVKILQTSVLTVAYKLTIASTLCVCEK